MIEPATIKVKRMSLSSGQIFLFLYICIVCLISCSDGGNSLDAGDSETSDGDTDVSETDADLDNFDSDFDFIERDNENDEDIEDIEDLSETDTEVDTGDSDEADSADFDHDAESDDAGECDEFDLEEHPIEILGLCEPCNWPRLDWMVITPDALRGLGALNLQTALSVLKFAILPAKRFLSAQPEPTA